MDEEMSGPGVGAVWRSSCRLRMLIISLLVSANTGCLQENSTALGHNLQCVSDYVSIINCSLSITASETPSESSSTSFQLKLVETYTKEMFSCVLVNTSREYSCTVEISSPLTDDDYGSTKFVEDDTFEISLLHHRNDGAEVCQLLTNHFMPFKNIKPNAPCCLTHRHQSGQHNFTWKSTYEPYIWSDPLGENLMYELCYYRRGDEQNVISKTINTERLNYAIKDDVFVRDTEYFARVRSSPNQAIYTGQWSEWSSEVHWRTTSTGAAQQPNTSMSNVLMVILPLCVTMPLFFLLCYAPIKRWRQGSFIPTPAPYFHTLYRDYQGDFKSWVVTQENSSEMMKAEETLQIDMLTKYADIHEEEQDEKFQPQFLEGITYSNISNTGCETSPLRIPCATSSETLFSDPGSSLKRLTFSSNLGSPAEGDSGCWLSSHTSLEGEPPWYCNEYCTLSAFQQISLLTDGKSCSIVGEQAEDLN